MPGTADGRRHDMMTRRLLLITLTSCALMTALIAPASRPRMVALAAEATPTPLLGFQNPQNSIVVIALAGDAPTSAKMTIELTRQLFRRKTHPIPSDTPTTTNAVLPLPGWGSADYVTLCAQLAESTPPALIIMPPSIQSATTNYFLGTRSWTEVQLVAVLATCDSGKASIAWQSGSVHDGIGSINNVNLLSIAAAFAGVNAVSNKSGSNQTQTTTTFPTPVPAPSPSPGATAAPGSPYTSSVQQTTTTSSNANSPNAILVGSAVLGALGSSAPSIGSTSTDRQFTVAATKAFESLVNEIMAARAACLPAAKPAGICRL